MMNNATRFWWVLRRTPAEPSRVLCAAAQGAVVSTQPVLYGARYTDQQPFSYIAACMIGVQYDRCTIYSAKVCPTCIEAL